MAYILISYSLGGIPFAFIITKIISRFDIRTKGSGNVGATNVLRILGPLPGILVLILDILKGFLVIRFAPENLLYLSGLAVIAGHCWTPFLKFKGGKGVATTLGVLAAINLSYLGYAIAAWLIVFLIFKTVSLSSIAAAVILPLILLVKSESIQVLIFITFYSAIVIYRHKQNIKRLLDGKEKRIKFKKIK